MLIFNQTDIFTVSSPVLQPFYNVACRGIGHKDNFMGFRRMSEYAFDARLRPVQIVTRRDDQRDETGNIFFS